MDQARRQLLAMIKRAVWEIWVLHVFVNQYLSCVAGLFQGGANRIFCLLNVGDIGLVQNSHSEHH